MWPVWSAHLDRTSCDLSFTETISQRMQVPSRLKVTDSASVAAEQRPPEEDCPPSFQMHVPERLLLSEMMEVASRTPFGEPHESHRLGVADEPLFEPSDQAAVYGELPFQSLISRAASQKRRHQAHHSRARKVRVPLVAEEIPQLALEAPRLKQDSSRDTSTSLEEFGTTDMLAMKKQVTRISGRLQALEAQCVGWRQKELLFYSILGPACLFHLWLWLRR